MIETVNQIITPEMVQVLGQITILGTIASLLVQGVKAAVGSKPLVLNAILVGLSITAAIAYGVLSKYGLLSGTLAIFAAASTIHNVFIRIAEKKIDKARSART